MPHTLLCWFINWFGNFKWKKVCKIYSTLEFLQINSTHYTHIFIWCIAINFLFRFVQCITVNILSYVNDLSIIICIVCIFIGRFLILEVLKPRWYDDRTAWKYTVIDIYLCRLFSVVELEFYRVQILYTLLQTKL